MIRALLVDDDPNLLEMLEMLCVSQGWIVVSRQSAENPRHLVEEADPDVLLTDLIMRPVPGKKLIEVAREVKPSVKVVVLSGVEAKDSRRTEVEAMAVDFWLEKPFDLGEFNTFLGQIGASLN